MSFKLDEGKNVFNHLMHKKSFLWQGKALWVQYWSTAASVSHEQKTWSIMTKCFVSSYNEVQNPTLPTNISVKQEQT